MEEDIFYKGCNIKVLYDSSPMNPFEEWDCEPSLMFNSGYGITDYSDGSIKNFLVNYLTDNQIIYHQRKIVNISWKIDVFNEYYSTNEYTKSERAEKIRDLISEFDIESLAEFCKFFNIPHHYECSKGYSQSDWAYVLVVFTDKDFERLGTPPELQKEVCKSTFKLFTDWAWGDVYGFQTESPDGDDIDSCWGFYGDDHEESGLLEQARDSIDFYIKQKNKERIKKLKELIWNKVNLISRLKVLSNYKFFNYGKN